MIKIKKNPYGDTRTAPICDSTDEQYIKFREATDSHRKEVYDAMNFLVALCEKAGQAHDYTKNDEKIQFFIDFNTALNNKDYDFTKGKWYQNHIRAERHHLNNYCPDDVNLIDVLEMITDCVCAGLARSDKVYPIEISSDILQLAVKNTVDLIENECSII